MQHESNHNRTLDPLTTAEKKLAERLKSDVYTLASEIGERNVYLPGTMDYSRMARVAEGLKTVIEELAGNG